MYLKKSELADKRRPGEYKADAGKNKGEMKR